MAWGHQGIDHRFVLGRDLHIQRRSIVLPLRQRARPGDDRTDMSVGQHPSGSKVRQRHAFALTVQTQGLRNLQRLLPKFGFKDALVGTSGAAAFGGCLAWCIFPREHAPGNRAVRDHTQTVVATSFQDFHLRQAVEQVVIGLANHGAGHVHLARHVDHLGDAPAPEIGHTPITNLAVTQQRLDGPQRLFEAHAVEIAVQVINVHVVGGQSAKAVFAGPQHPAARIALGVGQR